MKKRLVLPKRKTIHVGQEELVRTQPIDPRLGLLVTPAVPDVDVTDWAIRNRDAVEQHLLDHGAVLFRGFEPLGVAGFEEFIRRVSGNPIEYVYRSTPRSTVQGHVYTTTHYPADEAIAMHNENSYQSLWPLKLHLYCDDPPDEGGATPLSNSARVFERMAPEIRDKFISKKVMYVRNYTSCIDLPWQTVFQTDDRSEVEAYCEEAGIDFEWRDEDSLRTRQIRDACIGHPTTGEMLWFNQAHLFHVSNQKPEVRDGLLETYGEENLPRHAFYGDGSPIEPSALEEIRRVYDAETVSAPWERGDIAIVDNMKLAHAREPFKGTRRILIGMTDLSSGS